MEGAPVRGVKAMQNPERMEQTEMDEAEAEHSNRFIQLLDLGDGNVHLRIVHALPRIIAEQIRALLASTAEGPRVLH
jgi:hypothetical protein